MKVWEKPQLVVLTRSKPEEAVLGWCKEVAVGAGPDTAFAVTALGCEAIFGFPCGDCSAYTVS